MHNEKKREIVFLLLFGMTNHAENESRDLQSLVMQELKVSRSCVREAFETATSIVNALPEIDHLIGEVSSSFSLDRIQAAELAVLRLSFWELFIEKKLPPKVVFSETSRLIKKFAADDAVAFVRALLLSACSKSGMDI